MRNPWRMLLLRSSWARSTTHVSTHSSRSQVGSHSNLHTLPSLSSTFCTFSAPQLFLPCPELVWNPLSTTGTRCFSSEADLEPKDHDVFVDIVCKSDSFKEVMTQLNSNHIRLTEDLLLKALQNPDSSPRVAWKVLDWVLRYENGRLTSKCYNSMLGFFGTNGFVREFWDVFDTMKMKRYAISEDVHARVLEKFEKDGLVSDLEKLRGLYGSDDSVEKAYLGMYKIIRRDAWGDDVEAQLRGMNVAFSSDLVRMVLDSLSNEPAKALIFFRWVVESGLFKHDEQTYNAIARVLGNDETIDMFWKVVNEMKSEGYEIEAANYLKISFRFSMRKMMNDAVCLYELAMGGVNKPSVRACIFLLKKIVTSEDFDINLLSRVVKVSVEHGNVSTNIIVIPVLNSLSSVGRFGELNKVLKAMQEFGFVSDTDVLGKIVSLLITRNVWGDDVEERLRGMNVTFSSDLVRMVLDSLSNEPAKALIFFRWVDESGLFKHDERTFNSIARVLGRDDCIDRFWKVVDEMTNAGYEIEAATYFKISFRFATRKMMNDAACLYELAMGGVNKPSVRDCIFLLKKITTSVVFDIDLFSRVVKVFVERGNVLTNIVVNPVLKYLSSVGRTGEFNKVFKKLQECGYLADTDVLWRIVSLLGQAENMDALSEFMDTVEASGYKLNYKTWTLLIKVHCVHGDLDKAADCFLKMLEKVEVAVAGRAFESLVKAYCLQHRALDVCKLLCDLVRDKQLKPQHTTYKTLIPELFVQGSFKDALNLLDFMKDHQLPDYLDPFIEYVSKSGTSEDAINFLEAMKLDRAKSTCVFLRVFEACFKAKRHNEAQDILLKCPYYIRNHGGVLNLFCSSKSEEGASTISAVA